MRPGNAIGGVARHVFLPGEVARDAPQREGGLLGNHEMIVRMRKDFLAESG